MTVIRRRTPGRSFAAVAVGALTLAGAVGAQAVPAGPAGPAAPKPGPAGPVLTLDANVGLVGYDAATAADGTTYLAWIASTTVAPRVVRTCVLRRAARACVGGIRTTAGLDYASPQGVRVLIEPAGGARVVWFHDTPDSVSGPNGGRIASATVSASGAVSSPADVAVAPSFGALLSATRAPKGQVWMVARHSWSSPQKLAVYSALQARARVVTAPYAVNDAQVAFPPGKTLLAVDRYGSISSPIHVTTLTARGNGPFKAVPNTWNVGGFALTPSDKGLRLISSVANASYYPAVSKWTGSAFTKAAHTGYKPRCPHSSTDASTDASGRVAFVTSGCDKVAVSNMANTVTAKTFIFDSRGTIDPVNPFRIATHKDGTGWVMWSASTTAGNRLLAVPVRLP